MTDLRIDPTTEDIVMTRGRPEVITGKDAKAQRIRARLLTVRGEWFLDTTFGLDYLGVVFVKGISRAVLAAHIKTEILRGADAGDLITQFDMSFDSDTRALTVAATLESPDGTTTTVGT